MGYTTDFEGQFKLNKQLSTDDLNFLKKFSDSRRMARNVGPEYGIEGELFVDGSDDCFGPQDKSVIDYNRPPKTQPGLWCNWVPTDDGMGIEWNGHEKFYDYVEWLQYLINRILAPRGYVLNGSVKWYGEDREDNGIINVKDNVVTTYRGVITYEEK